MVARVALGLLVGRRLGPLGDPGLEQRDLRGRERLSFRRHPLRLVGRGHSGHEQALGGILRLDRRPALAPFDGQRRGIEPQARLLLQRPVAGVAALLQDRLDLADDNRPARRPSHRGGPGHAGGADQPRRRQPNDRAGAVVHGMTRVWWSNCWSAAGGRKPNRSIVGRLRGVRNRFCLGGSGPQI